MKLNLKQKLKIKNDISQNLVVIITLINMLLAVAALGKDIFMASYLGTTEKSDAFTLAFFITDMIGNNLIASAVGVSCIPFFTRAQLSKDKNLLSKRFKDTNIVFSIITFALAFILFVFRNSVIKLLAQGFTPGTTALSIKLFIILLPTIILYPLVSTGVSYMQVGGKFIVSSLAPVIFNLIFLIGIIYCYIFKIPTSSGVYIISFSVLLSVMSMILLIYFNIVGKTANKEDYVKSKTNLNLGLFKLFMPYSLILFISQIVLYYERYLASQLQAGSVAALSYTFRLSQFPIWVFVSAIGTVVFPLMSKHSSEGNTKELSSVFKKALWWALVLTVPIIIMLYALRLPIVEVLFLRGAFDINSLNITTEIFSSYVFVILGQSITAISLKRFLAEEKIKKPLIIYIFSSSINIVLDNYLVKTLGIKGLGYGAAISSLVNALMMIYISKLSLRHSLNRSISRITKLVLANVSTILICFLADTIWNTFLSSSSFLIKFIYLSFVVITTLVSYAISLKALKLL